MQTRVAIMFVALLIAAGVAARADHTEDVPPRATFDAFPMHLGEWSGMAQPPLSKAVLDVLRADDYLTRVYFNTDHAVVGLYIGFWRSQRQGDTIHSPLNCLPGAGWEPVSHRTTGVVDPRNPNGPTIVVNRYLIQKGIERQLVLYWYQSHSRIIASEYWSKFYLIADGMRLNRTDGAIVRVIAPMNGATAEAEQRAEQQATQFVRLLLPQLDRFLPL